MKRTIYTRKLVLVSYCILCLTACDKFLDEKSDGKQVIPETLADLQALLDNSQQRNGNFSSAGEVSADDYFLPQQLYSFLTEDLRRMHTWQPDHIFQTGGFNDWHYLYESIYYFSTALKALEDIPRETANAATWDNIKGQALANRAYRYLEAVLLWSVAYDEVTSHSDLGIPLRNQPDFNMPSLRATVHEVYQQILKDLKASIKLLPVTNINAARPTKAMAYGLLARTYLNMRNYEMAGLYADSCLQFKNELIDYNALEPNAPFPFPRPLNDEIIFLAYPLSNAVTISFARISQAFYDSYDVDDLRKKLYFSRDTDGLYFFKGYYTGFQAMFIGLATDEMVLIRAECLVRQGKLTEGLDNLNRLLKARWKTGTYVPIKTNVQEEALAVVLTERRKSLIRRGLRWPDIKRLNKEGANIFLERSFETEIYTLPPNDFRYALAIPEDVIDLSGIQQNPR